MLPLFKAAVSSNATCLAASSHGGKEDRLILNLHWSNKPKKTPPMKTQISKPLKTPMKTFLNKNNLIIQRFGKLKTTSDVKSLNPFVYIINYNQTLQSVLPSRMKS